jgi:Zn-dependent alcohol dehydrogenase
MSFKGYCKACRNGNTDICKECRTVTIQGESYGMPTRFDFKYDNTNVTTANFMLNEHTTINVVATEIDVRDDFVVAWLDDKVVAAFRKSDIVGCWLDGGTEQCVSVY